MPILAAMASALPATAASLCLAMAAAALGSPLLGFARVISPLLQIHLRGIWKGFSASFAETSHFWQLLMALALADTEFK